MTGEALDGFTFSMSAKLTDREEHLLPLARELAQPLSELGLEDSPDRLMPPGDRSQELTMVDGGTVAFGLQLLTGGAIGGWLIKKVCDEVYDNVVRPRMARRLGERRSAGWATQGMRLHFGVWLARDAVYIGVVGDLAPDADINDTLEIIGEAQRRALAWVSDHGITAPAVIFHVHKGQLAEIPHLLDRIPDAASDLRLPPGSD
jgi:hypothetical protein